LRLSSMRTGVAVRWIRYDATAAIRDVLAGEEVNLGSAKSAIGDIGGNHLIVVRREYGGHRAITAAGLPDRAAEANVPQQCLGHPARCGVEVPPLPLVAGD